MYHLAEGEYHAQDIIELFLPCEYCHPAQGTSFLLLFLFCLGHIIFTFRFPRHLRRGGRSCLLRLAGANLLSKNLVRDHLTLSFIC